jgi:hypothetical protein
MNGLDQTRVVKIILGSKQKNVNKFGMPRMRWLEDLEDDLRDPK